MERQKQNKNDGKRVTRTATQKRNGMKKAGTDLETHSNKRKRQTQEQNNNTAGRRVVRRATTTLHTTAI
jgi:uncharacterized protein YjhX (UPF0386 family)